MKQNIFHNKGKVIPGPCQAPHHEDVSGSGAISLTLALDGDEWSTSCPNHFTPEKRAPGIYWIEDWVGLELVQAWQLWENSP